MRIENFAQLLKEDFNNANCFVVEIIEFSEFEKSQ